MEAWIIWIIVAVLLVVTEVLSQQVWTLSLAAGALVALAVSLAGMSPVGQIAVMAVASVVAYFVLVPPVRRWYASAWRGENREDRTGMEALLGRRAVVTRDIRPGDLGYARIDGDYWQVRAPGVDHVITRGQHVSVTAYDSIILTVQLIKD